MLASIDVFAKTYSLKSGGGSACKDLQKSIGVTHKALDGVDLNAFRMDANKVIKIPVKLESLSTMGIDTSMFAGLAIEPDLGAIELHPDGRVFYQGQQISADRVDEICRVSAAALEDIIEGQSE